MAFSQEFIEKVLNTADIVEVIGEFVHLEKAGSNYKGLCPFHNERTPSFIVSPSKNIFKCFGCGEHGSVVGFLMKHEKFSFNEAIKWLANKYNIPIEEKPLTDEEKKELQEKDALLTVTEMANKFYIENLYQTQEGQNIGYQYFKQRGFTDETIKKFELGYAPNAKKALTEYALSKGYKLEYLLKTGLTIQKDDDIYDRFRGRVIFPIHSISGKVVGFAGRILTSGKDVAKYLNSPENPIYQKRYLLYGLFLAKNSIIKEDKCYLVEGYTDVMSLHQAGIQNVVASAGTSLTEEQVRIIRRFTKNLTLVFDGDSAGQKAAFRGIDLALKEDMNVKIVVLPEDEDPDSFAKKNYPDVVKSYLEENEQDFVSFKINALLKDGKDDPVKRAQVLKNIAGSIALIPDEIKRSAFVKQTAKVLQFEEKVIFGEVSKIIYNRNKKEYYKQQAKAKIQSLKQTPSIPTFVSSVDEDFEKKILYYLLNFGDMSFEFVNGDETIKTTIANFIITDLQNDELQFGNMKYGKLLKILEDKLIDNDTFQIDVTELTKHPDPEISDLVANLLADESLPPKSWYTDERVEQLVNDIQKLILSYKRRVIFLEINKLKEMLKQNNLSEDLRNEILTNINELNKLKAELTKISDKRVVFF